METYTLVREIQVNAKNTDKVIEEIPLPEIDVVGLTAIFGPQPEDPLFYRGYEITADQVQYFPDINFDLARCDYFVVCYRKLFPRELELLTINRYFQQGKTKRLVDFVLNEKTRSKFIAVLAHLKDLNYSKFRQLEKDEKNTVLKLIDQHNLNQCYVISENKHIDQQFLQPEDALNETIGYGMGTILVFGDAEIVYYEGESRGDRWVSTSV